MQGSDEEGAATRKRPREENSEPGGDSADEAGSGKRGRAAAVFGSASVGAEETNESFAALAAKAGPASSSGGEKDGKGYETTDGAGTKAGKPSFGAGFASTGGWGFAKSDDGSPRSRAFGSGSFGDSAQSGPGFGSAASGGFGSVAGGFGSSFDPDAAKPADSAPTAPPFGGNDHTKREGADDTAIERLSGAHERNAASAAGAEAGAVPTPAAEPDLSNGEEGEQCLHQSRCRLFAFRDNQYMPLGPGTLRVLQSRSPKGGVRMTVRADGTLRVLMNLALGRASYAERPAPRYVRISGAGEGDKPAVRAIKCHDLDCADELWSLVERFTERRDQGGEAGRAGEEGAAASEPAGTGAGDGTDAPAGEKSLASPPATSEEEAGRGE